MSWEMCFKEAREEENHSSLIFAGVRCGVGQARGPCPAVLGASSVSLPLCASVSSSVQWRE